MKAVKLGLLLSAFVVSLFATIVSDSSAVHAAPPRCFTFGGGSANQEGDCRPPFNEGGYMLTYQDGGPYDDHCYEASGTMVEGVGGTIVMLPRDCSELRQKLAASSQSTGSSSDGVYYNLEANCNPNNSQQLNKENCGIYAYLVLFINALSAMVGVVVVGMIIMGGIQYAMSADDPQKVSAAKDRIRNAIIALVAFIFTYAFLQWIVPGGVL